ncbi:MAG: hypothetical protein IT291_01965 [Deltaproteobacteria bacterium]|nr:hypothetical protein [Deltaproteobacteria bacterium]
MREYRTSSKDLFWFLDNLVFLALMVVLVFVAACSEMFGDGRERAAAFTGGDSSSPVEEKDITSKSESSLGVGGTIINIGGSVVGTTTQVSELSKSENLSTKTSVAARAEAPSHGLVAPSIKSIRELERGKLIARDLPLEELAVSREHANAFSGFKPLDDSSLLAMADTGVASDRTVAAGGTVFSLSSSETGFVAEPSKSSSSLIRSSSVVKSEKREVAVKADIELKRAVKPKDSVAKENSESASAEEVAAGRVSKKEEEEKEPELISRDKPLAPPLAEEADLKGSSLAQSPSAEPAQMRSWVEADGEEPLDVLLAKSLESDGSREAVATEKPSISLTTDDANKASISPEERKVEEVKPLKTEAKISADVESKSAGKSEKSLDGAAPRAMLAYPTAKQAGVVEDSGQISGFILWSFVVVAVVAIALLLLLMARMDGEFRR